MSVYNFTPMVTNSQNHPFISWENGFTEEEIQTIIDYCETIPKQESTVAGNTDYVISDEKIRRSEVAWIKNNQKISWLYDRLGYIAKKINSKFYNFDLIGFNEDFQYTVYNEEDSGHYDWHLDLTGNNDNTDTPPRKLSLVLQLSDPNEYEGGELQTFTSPSQNIVVKQKGLVVAFPSWTLHRVTPVTKGTRRTLVVWITGPQFK